MKSEGQGQKGEKREREKLVSGFFPHQIFQKLHGKASYQLKVKLMTE